MTDDRLRIGDAERDAAAAALGEHFAQGRLSADEHTDRLDRIWAARTRADLAPVFADLPAPYAGSAARFPSPAAARTPPPRRGPGPFGRRWPAPLVPVAAVLLLVTVVTHLPVILIGLAVFWLLAHRGHHRLGWRRRPAWRP